MGASRLVEAGLLKGKTVAIDATTLEANAAMRSIVRRDTGESYQEFLTALAQASGIETPTREELARLDRKRKKQTSNKDWTHPGDPDAKIAKMKDGRTHLAHKAEHAVDLETGAMVAVTLQGADAGDTTTIIETAIAAAEQIEDAQADVTEPQALDEIIADKGYHSNQTMVDLDAGWTQIARTRENGWLACSACRSATCAAETLDRACPRSLRRVLARSMRSCPLAAARERDPPPRSMKTITLSLAMF